MSETQTREMVTLKRDTAATLVPSGDAITLKEGQEVIITQELGGSYTVIVLGNMALIDGRDADALGKSAAKPKAEGNGQELGVVDEMLIWDQLKTCFDPEIPVNIVDLGLIYDLQISPADGGKGAEVTVKMTLTAPGCGMGDVIARDVQQKVESVPSVIDAKVELVWEPTWNQSMMTEAARLQLGFM
ncbi:MAG: putative Fe-S cluster assembly protein SufT [Candidatus Marinimicrobia bacterium]|nr:putative Fe-S cluster assembly protein SufT [Candidatus Neomarinimicrobiota bacterium]